MMSVLFGLSLCLVQTSKMFEIIRETLHQMGIDLPFSFNFRNLFLILALVQAIISSVLCFLWEAKLMSDYGLCFYAFVTESTVLAIFAINIWKIADILKLFEKCEKFVEKSKQLFSFFFYFLEKCLTSFSLSSQGRLTRLLQTCTVN